MGMVERLVPDELCELFQRVVPKAPSRPQGGGRHRHGDREVLAAIVFVVTSSCTWQQLPTSSFFAFPLMTNLDMLAPRKALLVADADAHSRYYSEDVQAKAPGSVDLVIVPGADHVDLYDRKDLIPSPSTGSTNSSQRTSPDPQVPPTGPCRRWPVDASGAGDNTPGS